MRGDGDAQVPRLSLVICSYSAPLYFAYECTVQSEDFYENVGCTWDGTYIARFQTLVTSNFITFVAARISSAVAWNHDTVLLAK